MKLNTLRKLVTLVITTGLTFGPLAYVPSQAVSAYNSNTIATLAGQSQDINRQIPLTITFINRDNLYTRDGLVDLEVYLRPSVTNPQPLAQVRFLFCNGGYTDWSTGANNCKTQFTNEAAWSSWQDLASFHPKDAYAGKLFNTQQMLSDPRGAGLRTVCIQTKDAAGQTSLLTAHSCDDIRLDNIAPTGSIVLNDGAAETNSARIKLDIYAQDPLLPGGVKGSRGMKYTVSTDRTNWRTWYDADDHVDIHLDYPGTFTQPTTITYYLKLKDALGNESGIFSDSILYNPLNSKPSSATAIPNTSNRLQINNGAAFTDNQTVQLHFTPKKPVAQVKVWNRGQNADQIAFSVYSEYMNWQLSAGYEQKQVYAQFAYTDGTKSEQLASQIIFAPKLGIVYSAAVAGYSEFTLGNFPNELASGVNVNTVLSVQNIGSTCWLNNDAAEKTNNNALHVSYHWYRINPDGSRSLYLYQGNRAQINNSLDYLAADNNVRFAITTPDQPGTYVLQFDAVFENPALTNVENRGGLSESNADLDWLSEFANPTPEVTIQIVAEQSTVRTSQLISQLSAQLSPTLISQDAMSRLIASGATLQSAVQRTSTTYTVQPPRAANWHCGGYDCYSGIAEDFYQCSSRGIPNDAPDTTNESLLRNKCWWPIFNANRGLYSGLNLPAYYVAHPWQYLQVGWVLTIPADPFGTGGGGGTTPPSIPGVPVLPPIPGSVNGVPGSTIDPYAGINGANMPISNITFDRFIAWDGSYKTDQIKWSETTRPQAPTITSVVTADNGASTTVYGVAIPKNHPIRVGVWNEFRYCWACGSGWEYFSQMGTAQHVKVVLFKSDWTYLGYVWNDRADGRWSVTLPLGGVLKADDVIKAEVQVEADYTFSGLHWWSNTTETVNFNLRDRKYTGYPYFASYASNTVVVPNRRLAAWEWAIMYREQQGQRSPAGDIHTYCGAYIRDYYFLTAPNDAWQTYTNLIYNPAHNWAYRLRGDIRIAYWNKYNGTCGVLGLPTSDDLWAAPSPQGTTGAYQQFQNGTIHSSVRGTYATTGVLNQLHTNMGGTASQLGFPVGEMYSTTDKGKCQNFEGGQLCEVDANSTNSVFLQKELTLGNVSRLGTVHTYCGTMIQDYNTLGSYGRSSLIQNPNNHNVYLLTGGIAYTYFNQGSCAKFGYPTMDPAATGRISGWYQTFEKADIYWDQNNSKPGIVSGDIRNYYLQLGGTWNNLGFPDGDELSPTPEKCDTSKIGHHQNFNGGKIYVSSVAKVSLSWDDWLYRYIQEGEMSGSLGWPRTEKQTTIDAWRTERIYFEQGYLEGQRTGPFWVLNKTITGCGDTSRRAQDAASGAPTCVIEALWNKEETSFVNYVRRNNVNGALHRLTGPLWIADYDSVNIGTNNRQYGWSAIVADERNCQAHYIVDRSWEWYRSDSSNWTNYGGPVTDSIIDYDTRYHEGNVDWQVYERATFTYAFNLKLGYGISNLGSWRNQGLNAIITNPEVNALYASGGEILEGLYDPPYVDSFLGAPVTSDWRLTNIPTGSNTSQQMMAQEFQGGWIVLDPGTNTYRKVLNGYAIDKAVTAITGFVNSNQAWEAFFTGFSSGFGSVITDVSANLFQFALAVVFKISNPVGWVVTVATLVVSIARVIQEVINNWNTLLTYFDNDPTAIYEFMGDITGAVIGGAVSGIALNAAGSYVGGVIQSFAKSIVNLNALSSLPAEWSNTIKGMLNSKIPAQITSAEEITTILKSNPSITGKITGQITRLSDSELLLAVKKVAETGKTFDVDEYFNFIANGLVNNIDDFFRVKFWMNFPSETITDSSQLIDDIINDSDNYLTGTDGLLTKGRTPAHMKSAHIDILDSDLQARAVSNINTPITKFNNMDDASYALSAYLEQYKMHVTQWLSTAAPGDRLKELPTLVLSRPIGYGYLYDGVTLTRFDNLDSIYVILEKLPNGGFIPVTGFAPTK